MNRLVPKPLELAKIEYPPVPRRPRRVGAFLSGGGFAGARQAGGIAALSDAGIYPDVCYGISVGSLNGAKWMMRQGGRLRQLWAEIDFEDVFAGAGTVHKAINFLRGRGLYSNAPLRRLVEREIVVSRIVGDFRAGFCDLETETYHVASTKDPLYAGRIHDAIIASTTIPVQHTPARMRGPVDSDTLVDGGVWNVAPIGHVLDVAGDIDLLIVINCAPEHPPIKPRRRIPTGVDVARSSLSMLIDQSIVQDMKTFRLLNTLTAWNGGELAMPSGKVYRHVPTIVLQPSLPLGSGMDARRERLDELFIEGYDEACRVLDGLGMI